MPRPLRYSVEGKLYHIIMRGNNRNTLFHSTGEYYRFCQLMEEGLNHFDHSLVTYCLMTNHVHMVVKAGPTSLSAVYHDLGFRYARFYHHVHKSSGHVFQDRFKSIPVENASHMRTLIRYIHLNPVKAGIVERPQEYRWSSHSAYLGDEEIPCLSPKIGLEYFNFDKNMFQKYVMSGVKQPEKFDIDTGKLSIKLETIVDVVRDHYDLEPEAIRSDDRASRGPHARSVVAHIAGEVHGISLQDLADYFSLKPESVGRSRTRLNTKISASPQIRSEIENIYSILLED